MEILTFVGPKRKEESDPRQTGPGPSRPKSSREPGGIPEYADPLRVGRGDLDPFAGGFAGRTISRLSRLFSSTHLKPAFSNEKKI